MGLPIVSEAVTILLKNPIFAWLSTIFILIGDSFVSGLFSDNATGVFGYIFTSVFNFIGINVTITSFQLLFLTFIIPVLVFVLQKSGRV